jgi:hypothetical protein
MWIVKKAWKIFSIITESFHVARDSWFHHLPHAHHKQASCDRLEHAYAHYASQFCRSHENLHSYPAPLIHCKLVDLHFVRYWGELCWFLLLTAKSWLNCFVQFEKEVTNLVLGCSTKMYGQTISRTYGRLWIGEMWPNDMTVHKLDREKGQYL